jgi:hypothetical protein
MPIRLTTRALAIAGALVLAPLATACAGTYGYDAVYGYEAVPATVVPPTIEAYPRTYYRGSYAYLVGDQWYYPTQRGWMVFREEPRELGRFRTQMAPAAPRVRAMPAPGYAYPPVAPRRKHVP